MAGQKTPDPWASASATDVQGDGAAHVLLMVEEVQAKIPGWRATLTRVTAEAKAPTPDAARLHLWLASGNAAPPQSLAEEFAARDTASADAEAESLQALSAQSLLGDHASLLVEHLGNAAGEWTLAESRIGGLPGSKQALIGDAAHTDAELSSALQHALFLTFLADARAMHVGQQRGFADHCRGWGLTSAQIDETWGWLTTDMPRFGGQDLCLVLDTNARAAYKAPSPTARVWLALMPLWGAVAVYGLVALLFVLLHAAHAWTWPTPDPGWKLLVLLLFVVLGAALHVGSRWVNVNYDNPIKVYDAGGILNWLSLRWLGVLQYYVPVVFVVASLWGAKNIPTAFAQLGTALLAGYTADSAFGAAVSKLQSQATPKTTAVQSAATSTSTGGSTP